MEPSHRGQGLPFIRSIFKDYLIKSVIFRQCKNHVTFNFKLSTIPESSVETVFNKLQHWKCTKLPAFMTCQCYIRWGIALLCYIVCRQCSWGLKESSSSLFTIQYYTIINKIMLMFDVYRCVLDNLILCWTIQRGTK